MTNGFWVIEVCRNLQKLRGDFRNCNLAVNLSNKSFKSRLEVSGGFCSLLSLKIHLSMILKASKGHFQSFPRLHKQKVENLMKIRENATFVLLSEVFFDFDTFPSTVWRIFWTLAASGVNLKHYFSELNDFWQVKRATYLVKSPPTIFKDSGLFWRLLSLKIRLSMILEHSQGLLINF